MSNERIGAFRRDVFIVITAEKRSTVDLVELLEELGNADELVGRTLVGGGDDVQPGCETISILWNDFRLLSLPTIAQIPSFSRIWSDPVPNDSSPQIDNLPASIKLPKNFQPVRDP